jgi:hypothetical protein
MTMLRSVLMAGGLSTKVTSVCHWLALLISTSTSSTFGVSPPGTVGCAVVSRPNRAAKPS